MMGLQFRFFLWGDSHASALMSSLFKLSAFINVNTFNTSGCPSLVGIHRKKTPDCNLHNNFIVEYLTENPDKYGLVLNVSVWSNYIEMNLSHLIWSVIYLNRLQKKNRFNRSSVHLKN